MYIGKQYKKYIRWGIIASMVGILLIFGGLVMYIWGEPSIGINLASLQPVIVDGSKCALLGIVFLITGGYRLIFGKKRFLEDKVNALSYTLKEDEKMFYNRGMFSKKEVKEKTAKIRKELQLYQLMLRKLFL
jgi:uncharacterized membrane protein